MALIFLKNISNNCSWGIWKIEEDFDVLTKELSLKQEDEFLHQIQVEHRKKESISARLVVKKILESWKEGYQGIYKDDRRKPFLKASSYSISLAHTPQLAVGIVHRNQNVGVDIERPRKQLYRIAHKFLSDNEASFVGRDLDKLTIVWASKEALYKLYGRKELIFKENMIVQKFNIDDEKLNIILRLPQQKDKVYQLHFRKFAEHYIAMVY